MSTMKLCPKCGSLVSYNLYFGAYICSKCKLRDDSYDKIRIKKYQDIFNIGEHNKTANNKIDKNNLK